MSIELMTAESNRLKALKILAESNLSAEKRIEFERYLLEISPWIAKQKEVIAEGEQLRAEEPPVPSMDEARAIGQRTAELASELSSIRVERRNAIELQVLQAASRLAFGGTATSDATDSRLEISQEDPPDIPKE